MDIEVQGWGMEMNIENNDSNKNIPSEFEPNENYTETHVKIAEKGGKRSRSRSRSQEKRVRNRDENSFLTNKQESRSKGNERGSSKGWGFDRLPGSRGPAQALSINQKELSAMVRENPGKLIIPQWNKLLPQSEFNIFQEHLSLTRDGLNEAYEKYQNKFIKKRLDEFQDENQTFDWFQSRYNHDQRQIHIASVRSTSKNQAKFFENILGLPEISSLNFVYNPSVFQGLSQPPSSQNNPSESGQNPSIGQRQTQLFSIEPAPIRFLIKPHTASVPYKTFTFPSIRSLSDAPFFSFDPTKFNLFMWGIPKSVSKNSIVKKLSEFAGFIDLQFSDPLEDVELRRHAWIFFDSEENCKKAEEVMKGKFNLGKCTHLMANDQEQKGDDQFVDVCKGGQGVLKGRFVDSMEGFCFKKHLEASEELIRAFDKEKSIESNSVIEMERKSERSSGFQFDLQLLYLRRVHYYCYFSGWEFENEREASAKCGVLFLHGEILKEEDPKPETQGEEEEKEKKEKTSSWGEELLKNTKRKTEMVKARTAAVDKLIHEFEIEKDKFLQHEIDKNKESEGTCKCKHCGKFFENNQYMIKHYKLKHKDYVEKISMRAMDKAKKTVTLEYLQADADKIIPVLLSTNKSSEAYSGGPFGNFERGGDGTTMTMRSFKEKTPYQDLDDPAVIKSKLNPATPFDLDYDSL